MDESVNAISLAEKKELLAKYMLLFSKDEVRTIMCELEMNEFLPLFEKRNPLIRSTDINNRILYAMNESGLIGKIKEDKKEAGYYRVYSKR